MSAGGAVAGVFLAMVAVRGLAAFAPVSLPRLEHIAVDGRVLAFTAAIAALTSLVFGLVPAWRGAAAGAQRKLAVDSAAASAGDRAPGRRWWSRTWSWRSCCSPAPVSCCGRWPR